MGALETAKIAVVVCTRDRERATSFYRDVLGLTLVAEDGLAASFDVGGTMLRVSTVPDFTAGAHTIFGFRVPDVGDAVAALASNGVAFKRLAGVAQDERGILSLPDGTQVAWLADPDGNLVSVTNV
jgi:catechol 2,3-dioxygenase-like lactoylglutathione lyase family enzyme